MNISGLKQAPFRKRERRGVRGDDEVIEYADIDEVECLFETSGEQLVRIARLVRPRGMIMGEDDRRGIVCEGELDYFTRVYAGLRQRSTKELDRLDQAVACVEQQDAADFMGQAADA